MFDGEGRVGTYTNEKRRQGKVGRSIVIMNACVQCKNGVL